MEFVPDLLLFFMLLNTGSTQLAVGEKCITKSLENGECVLVVKCPDVIYREFLLQKNLRRIRINYNRCGFEGSIEIICCPNLIEKISTEPERKFTDLQNEHKKVCDKYEKSYKTVPAIGRHIFRGSDASSGEFPHVVAIGIKENHTSEGQLTCGGSLISNRWILTAAHCILRPEQPTFARIGTIYSNPSDTDKTDYNIIRKVIPSTYNRTRKYDDIALLKLERDVVFTLDAYPACLDTKLDDIQTDMIAVGWGKLSNNNIKPPPILQKAEFAFISAEICEPYFELEKDKLPDGLRNTQLCAKGHNDEDTCKGDSGGPLHIRIGRIFKIIGITSFGHACEDNNKSPGVYSRVSRYLGWIMKIVWPVI